jgi:hypothetical protein
MRAETGPGGEARHSASSSAVRLDHDGRPLGSCSRCEGSVRLDTLHWIDANGEVLCSRCVEAVLREIGIFRAFLSMGRGR